LFAHARHPYSAKLLAATPGARGSGVLRPRHSHNGEQQNKRNKQRRGRESYRSSYLDHVAFFLPFAFWRLTFAF
jgi:hypothetical protein